MGAARRAVDAVDFDTWAELAERDPAAFEARRERVIEEFIRSVPQDRQQRLRRLQWRIDQTRRRSGSPIGACIRISEMMWDSVLGQHGLLQHMEEVTGRRKAVARPKAQVLSMANRRPPEVRQ